MMQQETGGLKESEDGTVEPGTPTDDEEITIPSQDRNKKILDFPDNDISDEQTMSNTQREDWLLPLTFHGIYMFPAGILYHWVSVMHLWATLGCGVFSCHSNLVNHVRWSMSAPSVKSVAHRPLCA